jgi:histidyl-tRNA synthetase
MMVIDELKKWPTLENDTEVAVITLGEGVKTEGLRLANFLRTCGIKTEIDYSNNNLKPQFKLAERTRARFLLILGEDEVKSDAIVVKDSTSGEQVTINISELKEKLKIKGDVSYAYKK